jgi:maleylacetate reductase
MNQSHPAGLAFEHRWPSTDVRFGRGAIRQIADMTSDRVPRAVAVINSPSAQVAADRISADFGPRTRMRVDEVAMHVSTALVDATCTRVERAGIDLTVAVGGGSAMGLAKGIALRTGIPIVAVPTTYSGSEMTSIWGLTDAGIKVTGRDPRVRPVAVCYDPDLTDTLPVPLAVTSGLNAIAHCAEALYSPGRSPLGTMAASEGTRALTTGLVALTGESPSAHAREEALKGAWLAGMCLEVSTMGLHHRVCHVLGGLLDLPHSSLHAVMLPHAVGFNAVAVPDAAVALAAAIRSGRDGLGGRGGRRGVRVPERPSPEDRTDAGVALWELSADLGSPMSLREIGMRDRDLARAIDAVTDAVTNRTLVNPRQVERADIAHLLTAAFAGECPRATNTPRHDVPLSGTV